MRCTPCHTAAVSAYNELPTDSRAGRMHTLVYEADGLTSVEDLEGPGDPALWRLLDADGMEGAEEEEEEAAAAAAEEAEEGGGEDGAAEGSTAEGSTAEGGAAEGGAAETVWPQPKIEQMYSVTTIRNHLPITSEEASTFQTPPGWEAEQAATITANAAPR